jgi:hypothetical protein
MKFQDSLPCSQTPPPVHNFLSYLPKIHSNIILPTTLGSSELSLLNISLTNKITRSEILLCLTVFIALRNDTRFSNNSLAYTVDSNETKSVVAVRMDDSHDRTGPSLQCRLHLGSNIITGGRHMDETMQ